MIDRFLRRIGKTTKDPLQEALLRRRRDTFRHDR